MKLSPGISGGLAAMGAFGLWAIMPVYFKALSEVPAPEILSHRILWSALLTLLLCLALGQRRQLWSVMKNRTSMMLLLGSATLIAANWLLFIWSVNHDRLVEASLGYFINPLINMLLGFVLLKERLTPLQRLAAALALTGVLIKVIGFGEFPWIAIGLALSFGFYGLLRKQMQVDSLQGLCIETLLLAPVAFLFLWQSTSATTQWLSNPATLNILLVLAGPATTVPLLLFVFAGRRITLSVLGFFQYIAPSGMFILALVFYGEKVTDGQWWTFGFIWSALVLVTLDSARRYWRQRQTLADVV